METGIFSAPSSAFNIFNETLNTEIEIVRLFKVAAEVLEQPNDIPCHPISKKSLFQKVKSDDIIQATSDFFKLFVDSEMNSYKVFESDIEKSRKCTSVFEVVDDGIDSKRRFKQTYTGGFRNSILFQKVDESNSRVENRIDSRIDSLEGKLEKLEERINSLMSNQSL